MRSGIVTTLVIAGLTLSGHGAHAGGTPDANLADLVSPPDTRQACGVGPAPKAHIDRMPRGAKLADESFVLLLGVKGRQVLNREHLWAVDYSWIALLDGGPPGIYDLKSLFAMGDSLGFTDSTMINIYVGILREPVTADNAEQAQAEAKRLRPASIPPEVERKLLQQLQRHAKRKARTAERLATKP